jgi:tetrapyrrole methylase family protein/MazG family protein
LIAQVYSRAIASDLKLVLMNQYPDDHPTALLEAAGTPQQRVRWLSLYEIDRQPVTPLTTLFVAPLPGVTSFEGFQETIARLRSPEGCPWDREQTHQTLRTNLLEESYEVLEAIDGQDPAALQEELGDLLLQIVLHAQIAIEAGEFWMTDVIAQIDAKLKRRHPHVWGGVDVAGVGEVVTNWEAIKRSERAAKGDSERSLIDGIPQALPALAQAAAYVDRASRIGFDRVDPQGIWVALGPEIQGHLTALLGALDTAEASRADGTAQDLGDVLLVLGDWARRHRVDPESALRLANQRFGRKLRAVEAGLRASGESLQTMQPIALRVLLDAEGDV